jgi:hypothetical protein
MPHRAGSITANERLLSFVFGVVFLSLILGIAILIPNPTGFSYTIFRIVIALAAAGIGAVIPGFISVQFRSILRAGGAIALFVIVYFFAPVALGQGEPNLGPPPKASARDAAEEWLQKVDSGDLEAAYAQMSEAFKARYSKQEVVELIQSERQALGRLQSRRMDAATNLENPPGQPKGYYQSYGFRSKFEMEPRPIYQAVWLYAENGTWRPAGSYNYVKNDQGILISYDPPS